MTNIKIANIILKQLGGNKFSFMVGGSDYCIIEFGIQFKVKNGRNQKRKAVNLVQIVLASDDTYTIRTKYIRGFNISDRDEVSGVYVEQLIPTFESMTGLYTSMGNSVIVLGGK